ncbi:MAG: type III pantothenate kinase [Myxococcota bacterium]
MLLAIDIGNTNIVFGLYDKERIQRHWRMKTDPARTADEQGVLFLEMFTFAGFRREDVDSVIIACVVPTMLHSVVEMCRQYFDVDPMVVEPGIKTGVSILYENPKEVGADRIVNAVAAYEKYKTACIVVDFGTATTFDCISARGEYLGGAISPGINISMEALFRKASKLPRVEFQKPKNAIGRTTVQSMQAGLVYGYMGLVDGIVNRLKLEMGGTVRVCATGGLARLISTESQTIEEVDDLLTLEGLRIIMMRNRDTRPHRGTTGEGC